MIAGRPNFQGRVGRALAGRYPDSERSENVEDLIYDGFYGAADKTLLQEFQAASWQRRADMRGLFGDDRLQRLARRLIFAEALHLLDGPEREVVRQAIRNRWRQTGKTDWTTWGSAAMDLAEVKRRGAFSDEAHLMLQRFYRGYA